MKDVMKKRVVGAVVLVIIGIALPLLLARCMQGDGSDAQSMRVYEISPDGQAQQVGAPADGGKANAQRDEIDGSSGVPDPETDETPRMPEAVSPASQDQSSQSADTPTESDPADSSTAAVEPEPEPEPAGTAASEPDSVQASGDLRRSESFSGGYVVQVASFGDEANARRMAKELNGVFTAFYRAGEVDGKTYYRVRVGPFENADSANAAAAKLRQAGRATLVRRAE